MLGAIKQNISFALRTLLKNKGFTLTAVLTLALGIGSTTAIFRALGLLLAAVGIYGVMAFAVAQRTHEFGIRMALGAQRSRVINQVLREGTILAISGTVIGLGGAYLVGRAMQSTLFGVQALDVRAFSAVSFLLLLAALLACLYPAWRASRVEPLEALRYE